MKRTPMPPRKTTLARTTGLTRSIPMRRSRAMRAVSDRPDLVVPEAVRVLVGVRSGGRCEAAIVGVCAGPAVDVHHRVRRAVGRHAVWNLLHLCGRGNAAGCHGWIHAHPAEARARGWIVSAYSDPSPVPVLVRGGWVLLGADGSYLAVSR